METGDFYASSGVRLKDVRRGKVGQEIEIDSEGGITYTNQSAQLIFYPHDLAGAKV